MPGRTFRIVRTANATGAFNLNVGTGPLKALAVSTWCDVTYNGSAWLSRRLRWSLMAIKTAILMVADTEAEVPTNLPTGTVCIALDTSKIVRSNVAWSIGGSSGGAHTHPESEVTSLVTDLSGKAATAHTHAESAITNLVTDLAAKAATGHTHAESDTTNLVTDLAGKAATAHTHTEANVTNLVSDLAAKAAASHTHAESDTTNLVTDLAGKAATAHTHTEANVTNLVADLAAKAATSHTHAESDTTNLTTDLAAKATAGSALTESAEASSTPVAGATLTALGSGVRVFAFFTLPTTEKWYVITGIEWKNGGTVNGNVWCGVERVDANPPVLPGPSTSRPALGHGPDDDQRRPAQLADRLAGHSRGDDPRGLVRLRFRARHLRQYRRHLRQQPQDAGGGGTGPRGRDRLDRQHRRLFRQSLLAGDQIAMPTINVAITDTFVLRDNANVAITGKIISDFTTMEAYLLTNAATTAAITLNEIGAGEYGISFTPTVVGTWTSHIVWNSGGVFREFSQTYIVEAAAPAPPPSARPSRDRWR
jgi:hypothetical protein